MDKFNLVLKSILTVFFSNVIMYSFSQLCHVASGAPIGDSSIWANTNVSTLDFLNLNSGELFSVGAFNGPIGDVHVYMVTEIPEIYVGNCSSGTMQFTQFPSLCSLNDRYFGVFISNGTNTTYNVEYMYAGNPFYTPLNEPNLALSNRNNNSVNLWSTYSVSANLVSNSITKQNEMQGRGEYVLSINPIPATISANSAIIFCEGDSVILTSNSIDNNTWSTGETTQNIVVQTSGNYTLEVGNSNNCIDNTSASIVVTESTLPNQPFLNVNGTLSMCGGDSVLLISSAGDNYLWSTGDTTQSIYVTNSGSYSVQVGNTEGCLSFPSLSTNIIEVMSSVQPLISSSGPLTICFGDSVTLSTQLSPNYMWSTGETTQSINVSLPGSYFVQTTDSNGCLSLQSLAVNVVNSPIPIVPIITSGSSIFSICEGDSIVLSSSPGYSYLWSTGETTQSIVVQNNETISVQISDSLGCTSDSSEEILINVIPIPNQPFLNLNGDITICEGDTLILTTGESSFYLWSTGETSQSICVTSPGSFSVQIGSSQQCMSPSSDEANVVISQNPVADFLINEDVNSSLNSTIHFLNESFGAVSYQWNFGDGSNGSTTQNVSHSFPIGSENYVVMLIATNEEGCTDSISKIINITEDLIFYIPNSFSPNGDFWNDVFCPIFSSGYNPQRYNLNIFNRWGELIFESNNPIIGWDGTYNNIEVQEGTYTYLVVFNLLNSETVKKVSGDINLIR